jgi:PAS domain S-box-containing protein
MDQKASSFDWTARLQRAGRVANLLVLVIALAGLLGWLFAIPALQTLGADFPPITPAEILALTVSGCVLAALSGIDPGPRARMAAWAGSAVVAILALASMAEQLTARLLGMDFSFVSFARGEAAVLAADAAIVYLLLAVAMALAPVDHPRARASLRLLVALLVGIATVALIGLTFRIVRLYFAVPPLGLSLPAALALMLASFSLVARRPEPALLRIVEKDTPGAVIARQLLPAAVAVPLVLGWVQALGQSSGWFDIAAGEGVLAVSMIASFAALILWVGHKLDEINAHRSRAEKQADTQREWLQVTLTHIGDAVIATNRNGEVGFLNPAAESLIGMAATRASGRATAELIELTDERTGEPLPLPLAEALREMRPASAEGEPLLRMPDGTQRPVEVNAMPIRDPAGGVAGGVLVVRDARVRRERDRAMRQAYADLDRRVLERTAALEQATATLLQTFASSTPDLILAKDREGRLIMANPAALRALGQRLEDVVGRNTIELTGDTAEARRTVENDRYVIETGEPMMVEETLSSGNETRTFLVTKSPLRDEFGQVIGLIGVATDITERKRAHGDLERLLVAEHRLRGEAEQANRAKDEFLAIVSHELRSPLNALKGWSHVLTGSRNPDPTLVARAAQAIKRNVEHQTRLIDDLLDTSRIISGKLIIERKPVNLVDVVQAALEVSRPSAQAKNIEVRFTSAQKPVMAEGDHGRLQQVVINLVSNAIKFTPDNGLVEISLHREAERVLLGVRDTGIGISSEFLPHVFDRFSQADTSTTRRHGGLGIGLALVRHLVQLHGGRVRVESAGSGQGSVFTAELPAADGESVASGRPHIDERTQARSALNGVRVLAVDDDPDARDVIELALTHAGAQVRTCKSGDEFVAALKEELPDVLLLDIAMPDEDGFSVLQRARGVKGSAAIPAIAVTAFTHVDPDRFNAAGFVDRVGKPIEPARLIESIAAASAFLSEPEREAAASGA